MLMSGRSLVYRVFEVSRGMEGYLDLELTLWSLQIRPHITTEGIGDGIVTSFTDAVVCLICALLWLANLNR